MSEVIHKSHNVSKLMYQFVLPTKYRRVVISDEVEKIIKETCIKISERYELIFLEIGALSQQFPFRLMLRINPCSFASA